MPVRDSVMGTAPPTDRNNSPLFGEIRLAASIDSTELRTHVGRRMLYRFQPMNCMSPNSRHPPGRLIAPLQSLRHRRGRRDR